MTVRYWASLRAATGRESDDVPAGLLADVVETALRVYDRTPRSARIRQIASVCSVLVGEEPLGTRSPSEVTVDPGTVVEMLPPFAGGADV